MRYSNKTVRPLNSIHRHVPYSSVGCLSTSESTLARLQICGRQTMWCTFKQLRCRHSVGNLRPVLLSRHTSPLPLYLKLHVPFLHLDIVLSFLQERVSHTFACRSEAALPLAIPWIGRQSSSMKMHEGWSWCPGQTMLLHMVGLLGWLAWPTLSAMPWGEFDAGLRDAHVTWT